MANITSAIAWAAKQLEDAGVGQPRREAASLMAFSIAKDAAYLIAHPEYELTVDEAVRFSDAIRRRSSREPFQLIVGQQEFYRLEFEVEAGVLIPRHETELLVERAIEILREVERPCFFEVGVGTGCISVAILDSVKSATATAVDISDQALDLAARNAERHSVSDRLTLMRSDLFPDRTVRFDMIVSNPPYIPNEDARTLQPEVKNFDPPEALFSGADGLDLIRRIIDEAPLYLKPRGYLLIEIGQGQAERVKELFGPEQWKGVATFTDLQGIGRTMVARTTGRS